MSKYEDDARFSLFGPRPRPTSNEELTSSDVASAAGFAAEARSSAKTQWDGDVVDDPADVEYDRTWHVLLVQLLGRLEFGRASLEDPTLVRNPSRAVKIAAAMVNQVADAIATHVDPQRFARPIADSLAAAGRFLTAAQVASKATGKRSFFGLINNAGAESERAGKLQECMWVLRDMPLVLETIFRTPRGKLPLSEARAGVARHQRGVHQRVETGLTLGGWLYTVITTESSEF